MKASIVIAIIGFSSVAIAATFAEPERKAYACEAFPPGAPSQQMIDSSSAVFSGKVARFEKFSLGGEAGEKRIAFFEVDRYWKEPPPTNVGYKQLIVITEGHHAACGYDFEVGRSYLVYATKWWYDTESLYTGLGSGTQPIEDAQEHLEFLGEGKIPAKNLSWQEQLDGIEIQPLPKPHDATNMVLSIVGIGVVIAGAGAFFSFKKLNGRR